MTTVTLITVVRNDTVGLQKTYQSVASQKFSDWEMLIKDGSSNDGTAEIAAEIASGEPRVRLVQGRDRNLYDGMNMSLAEARGEYVLFLNAGDELLSSDALAASVSDLRANPAVEVAFFGTVMAFEYGNRITRPAKPVSYIGYGLPGIHQATFFKTAVHRATPYDLQYSIAADYVAMATMIRNGALAMSFPRVISTLEVAGNSKSFAGQVESRRQMKRAIREIWGTTGLRLEILDLRRLAATTGKTWVYFFGKITAMLRRW